MKARKMITAFTAFTKEKTTAMFTLGTRITRAGDRRICRDGSVRIVRITGKSFVASAKKKSFNMTGWKNG